MMNKVESDESRARLLCQKMLEYGYISRVDESPEFILSDNPLYIFYEDRDDLAANMIRPYKGEK